MVLISYCGLSRSAGSRYLFLRFSGAFHRILPRLTLQKNIQDKASGQILNSAYYSHVIYAGKLSAGDILFDADGKVFIYDGRRFVHQNDASQHRIDTPKLSEHENAELRHDAHVSAWREMKRDESAKRVIAEMARAGYDLAGYEGSLYSNEFDEPFPDPDDCILIGIDGVNGSHQSAGWPAF